MKFSGLRDCVAMDLIAKLSSFSLNTTSNRKINLSTLPTLFLILTLNYKILLHKQLVSLLDTSNLAKCVKLWEDLMFLSSPLLTLLKDRKIQMKILAFLKKERKKQLSLLEEFIPANLILPIFLKDSSAFSSQNILQPMILDLPSFFISFPCSTQMELLQGTLGQVSVEKISIVNLIDSTNISFQKLQLFMSWHFS